MTTEVQWSQLQRDPKSVAALADQGDVRVRRRDGADLLLTREDRVRSASEGSVSAARALRNVLAHLPHDIAAKALLDECLGADRPGVAEHRGHSRRSGSGRAAHRPGGR